MIKVFEVSQIIKNSLSQIRTGTKVIQNFHKCQHISQKQEYSKRDFEEVTQTKQENHEGAAVRD